MSLDLSRPKMDSINGLSLLRNKRYFDNLLNVSDQSNAAAATFHAGLQQFGQLQHFMRNNFGSLINMNKHRSSSDLFSPSSIMDVHSAHNDVKFERKDEGKEVKSCLICGDRATGLHYGIISCEGCKGFFKRSICNRRVYRCTRSKNCVMSRKQRNRCQFCRLLKCLQMGMNRKAIREDGMPGGRNKSIGPVQISDEEIERILSGKDFEDEAAREEEQKAMEAQQRQIMIDNGNNNGHPYPAAIMPPGYLPFMPSPAGSNSNGAGQLDNSNVITSSSASPPIITNGNNTLRGGVPTSGTVPFSAAAARSYMAGSNAAAPQFMPHFPGVPIRDNAYYPGMPPVTSYQLPQINQFVPSQTQSNMSPDTNAELSSSNLVEQLVAAEDTNRLASLDNERVKENTVTKEYLFHTLCRIADEMLHRQIVWIKKLPFFDKLSIKDHTTLLSTTWAEIVLLAALCIHEDQLFGQLADITVKYFPGSEELSRFTDYEMEILEKMTHLYQKFSSLKIDHEDYVIMKVINFLNQDIKGLQQVDKVEDINKRYWYACQRFTELRAMERNAGRLDGSNATTPSTTNGAARFRDLMLCLPEIRCVAGKMLNTDVDKLPLLFKAILHTCKLQKINANNATSGAGNPNSNSNDGGVASSPPPSPTSSPANHQHNIQRSTHDEDKMAAAASMLDLTTTGPRVGVPHHHNGATPVRHFMNGSAAATMPSAGVVGAMYIPPVSPRSSSQGTASRDSNSETST